MVNLFTSMVLVAVVSVNVVHCDSPLKSVYKMPEKCRGQTYCQYKGDDYPSEQTIIDILTQNGLYDHISNFVKYSHRLGSVERSECRGTHERAPIYYVVDENNATRAVAQSAHPRVHYLQVYDVSRCSEEGPMDRTRHIMREDIKAAGVSLSCRTRHALLDFHVLSASTPSRLEMAMANIPVCCNCRYDKH